MKITQRLNSVEVGEEVTVAEAIVVDSIPETGTARTIISLARGEVIEVVDRECGSEWRRGVVFTRSHGDRVEINWEDAHLVSVIKDSDGQ